MSRLSDARRMYKAAIDLLSSVPPALTQQEFDELMKFVKKHIAEEEKAIVSMEEVINLVEDEKVKLLGGNFFRRRHHKLLNEVMNILVKRENHHRGRLVGCFVGKGPVSRCS